MPVKNSRKSGKSRKSRKSRGFRRTRRQRGGTNVNVNNCPTHEYSRTLFPYFPRVPA